MPTFLIRIALFLSISVSAFCADSEFQEVKKLAEQQKFEAALQKTRGLIEVARKKKNDHFLAEALIQATQLEMALHGYETAVRFLKESAWPKDGLERVLLHLYYARALMKIGRAHV